MTTFRTPRLVDRLRAAFIRNAWLCPLLALAIAAAIPVAFGLSTGTAILIALFLVCPAIMFWGLVVTLRRPGRKPASRTEASDYNGGRHAR